MGLQLKFLVKNSNDPTAAMVAIEYLRTDGMPDSCRKAAIDDFRNELIQHSSMLAWNPQYVWYRRVENSAIKQDVERVQKTIESYTSKTSVEDRFKKEQLKMFMKQQQRQQQEMASMWRDLMKVDDAIVQHRLSDPNPLVRMLAVQVAGKRRLPVEKEAIGLLADPYPEIRQSARQTLVRLGRGVDFGPEPTATGLQIAMSRQNWNLWLSMQQDAPAEKASPAQAANK